MQVSSAGGVGGVADLMVFDRVVELEVVMGGNWQSRAKTGALWDIKISRGILGLLKKNTG